MSDGSAGRTVAGQSSIGHYSIGEVLDLLKGEFPDVTISKIRFLESQGLIEPERTPSGYRKFSEDDIDRLRWVLVQQRDHFLPLRVIRERLDVPEPEPQPEPEEVAVARTPDDNPRRPTPRPPAAGAGPRLPAIFADRPRPASSPQPPARPQSRGADLVSVSLTAAELAETTGLTTTQIAELDHFGILVGRPYGGERIYDDEALVLARASAGLIAHGLEPRHLRSYLLAAQREAGILEQAVSPWRRHRDAASRQRAGEVAEELARHGDTLRAGLVRRELRGPGR